MKKFWVKRVVKIRLALLLIIAISIAQLVSVAPVLADGGPRCQELFQQVHQNEIIAQRGAALPERATSVRRLADFALEHNLPWQWVETGPAERRTRRLYVGIDHDNAALVQAYADAFNLNTPTGPDSAGTLVLEFQQEVVGNYVTGVLRPSANLSEKIYRWGRPDLTRTNWFSSWMQPRVANSIYGYGHLIELSAPERDNVAYYLQHSDVSKPNDIVAQPKSDNCVAWTSGIELGESRSGATAEERKHLFSELGIARAMAHFEINRRLIHAANDRHSAMVVFYQGEEGLKSFANIKDHLPPEPKIPYANIIRNLKIASPAEAAISTIPDGAKVFLPIAAGASPEAVNALIERSMTMAKGFDVHVLVNGISENAFRKGVETTDGKFRVHALFLGGNLRALNNEGKVSVIPGNLSDFNRLVRDPLEKEFHYDAIVVRVAPKDTEGRYSLGPNNDMIMAILRDRPGIRVIAEVNEKIPHTFGDNYLTEEQISAKFMSTAELAGPAVVPANEVDTKIGHYIGGLVESGATLQIGIGNIFSAVPEGLTLANRKDIKVSTEMFGDPMMEMIKNGTVTHAETGFAYGSGQLYKWLNHNAAVKFVETEYVNSPGRIASIPNFHAVNTALQVNLFGEVNATMGPNGRISSPGGQVEFMTGAARSQGGKAIIAIRSTAKDGAISSITLDLYRGPVTTPHESVSHVVTEYGVAKLKGLNESQRAFALISIAHPKFRPQLIHDAVDRKIISPAEGAAIELN